MKDSGIEWIGEIPTDWKISRLKNIKDKCKYAIVDGPFGTAISTDDYVEEGVPLVRILNLGNPNISNRNLVYITDEHAEKVQRSRFGIGDVVFAKTGATIGKCAINDSIEYGILSSSCVKITISPEYYNKYFYYFFLTKQFNDALRMACVGTTRDTINLTPFACLPCVVPSFDEQHRIADFLDRKCAEIDSLIADTQRTIEEYKKLKQSVITQAVSKGVRGARDMKDSGSVWFGEIPAEWRMVRLKYMFHIKKDIAGKEGYTVLSITQRGITPKNIESNEGQLASDYSKYQLVEPGDFAMNHMDLLTGWVDISKYDGVTSPDYRVFVLDDEASNKEYYLYMMQMCYFNRIFYGLGQGVSGMGRWRLQADKFLNFYIAVPPAEEQVEIVEALKKQLSEMDALITAKEQLLIEMESYKKSVIYEYVTGKKEVPACQ